MILHSQVKLCHLKRQTPKHVEIIKFQINLYMIHHSKGLDLEITDFEYHHDPTCTRETKPSQTLKHVQMIKFSDKPLYDTSFERS